MASVYILDPGDGRDVVVYHNPDTRPLIERGAMYRLTGRKLERREAGQWYSIEDFPNQTPIKVLNAVEKTVGPKPVKLRGDNG